MLLISEEQKDFVTRYNIKKSLVKQNITLLEAKLSNKSFSYTKIVNTYEKWIRNLLDLFNIFKNSLFFLIFLYSLFFILFLASNYFFELNYNINLSTLKYLILLIFLYFFFSLSKNTILIISNSVIFFFLIITYLVNF